MRIKTGLMVAAFVMLAGCNAPAQHAALMLIHGKDAQSEKNIEALRGIYKSRFAQESVMRVDQPVCVQF